MKGAASPYPRRRAGPRRPVHLQNAASRSAMALAQNLANPYHTQNLRLVAQPSDSELTATTLLHSYSTHDNVERIGNYSTVLPNGNSFVGLFRDPLRHTIRFESNPNAGTTTPNAGFTYEASFAPDPPSLDATSNLVIDEKTDTFISPLYLTSTTDWQPHGKYLYAGRMTDGLQLRYVWMDMGTQMQFALTQGGDSGDKIIVYRACAGGSGSSIVAELPYGYTTFTISVQTLYNDKSPHYNMPGYYAFVYKPATTVLLKLTMKLTSSFNYWHTSTVEVANIPGDCFGHRSVPGIDSHWKQMTRARVNASSVMVSPLANFMNQSGQFHGITIPNSMLWYDNVNVSKISELVGGMPGITYARKEYGKGMYAFLRPSVEDLNFKNSVTLDPTSGAITDMSYVLDANSTSVLIGLSVPMVGTEAASCIYEITQFATMEFVPYNDQWFEVHRSEFNYMDTIAALSMIATFDTFYENPSHAREIAMNIGRHIWKHRGAISRVIATLFPSLPTRMLAAAASVV